MKKAAGRGRRPGSPDTRERIRDAARRRFLAEGYQAVTMRAIALDAGVDVALLSYYFGSKQSLFGAAMALPANPAELFQGELDGDIATLGERVLRTALAVWDAPETGVPLATMAAAAAVDPDLNRLVREIIGRELTGRLAERLDGPDAMARAMASTAQMAGVLFCRSSCGSSRSRR